MLSRRQKTILELVEQQSPVSAKLIIHTIRPDFECVSKPTILRDLKELLTEGLIAKSGRARSIVYLSKTNSPLLKYFEVANYFNKLPDERIVKQQFQRGIFDQTKELFSETELKHLQALNAKYQSKKARLDSFSLKKELERITIELSWKSSQLEGNTYSLIDTETLIKEMREAPGHPKKEAAMILNHKAALDYIFNNSQLFKQIKVVQIRAIHSLLIKNLEVPDDFRKILVGIVGTKYQPLQNQFQIIEAVEKTTQTINAEPTPPAKALLAATFLAYIQPFADGNTRAGRLGANALLLANDWCPMSLRSMDVSEYKKALILFYEQNSLRYFKELFIQQFEFAVDNYFG